MAREVFTIEEVVSPGVGRIKLPDGQWITIRDWVFVPNDYAGQHDDEVFMKIMDPAVIEAVDQLSAQTIAMWENPDRSPPARRCEATPLLVCRTVR